MKIVNNSKTRNVKIGHINKEFKTGEWVEVDKKIGIGLVGTPFFDEYVNNEKKDKTNKEGL